MVHRHRDNLTGEHRFGDIGQLTFFCLFMALWILDIFLGYSNFLNEYVLLVLKLPIGALLLIISVFLARAGLLIVFSKKAPSQGVIKTGIFSLVRHPIYLSEIILYLGLLVLNISLAATIVWVLAILFLHYISRYEEKLLLAKFGEEYKQYIKEVPMWIPCIYSKK